MADSDDFAWKLLEIIWAIILQSAALKRAVAKGMWWWWWMVMHASRSRDLIYAVAEKQP
jgi:hypothetical protein